MTTRTHEVGSRVGFRLSRRPPGTSLESKYANDFWEMHINECRSVHSERVPTLNYTCLLRRLINHFHPTSGLSRKTLSGWTGKQCSIKHRTKWAHKTLCVYSRWNYDDATRMKYCLWLVAFSLSRIFFVTGWPNDRTFVYWLCNVKCWMKMLELDQTWETIEMQWRYERGG